VVGMQLLDECHHAKDDHPTAKVLEFYHKSSQQTQIIGLTASPTSKSSVVGRTGTVWLWAAGCSCKLPAERRHHAAIMPRMAIMCM